MAIHLGRVLRRASRDLPGRRSGNAPAPSGRCRPYSVLLPVGFALPPLLPGARCALAAPFRPCPRAALRRLRGRFVFCGTFPGVAPAGRYPAPYSRGARTFLYRLATAAAVRPSDMRSDGGRTRRTSSGLRSLFGKRDQYRSGAHNRWRASALSQPSSAPNLGARHGLLGRRGASRGNQRMPERWHFL